MKEKNNEVNIIEDKMKMLAKEIEIKDSKIFEQESEFEKLN